MDVTTLALVKSYMKSLGQGGQGGQNVDVDRTLTKEGYAADAKAVGDALMKKAEKPLIIYADNAPVTGESSASGTPIFIIDYTPGDLKKHAENGGTVTIVRYDRHYEMYDANDETAKFRFIEATNSQVDWYHAVLDKNGAVTITKTTHKSKLETTSGGAVGQIPCIKSMDSKGCPNSWSFMSSQDLVEAVLAALPNGDEVNY